MKKYLLLLMLILATQKLVYSQTFQLDTLKKSKQDTSKKILVLPGFDTDLKAALRSSQPGINKTSPEVSAFQAIQHAQIGHYTGKTNAPIAIASLAGKAIETSVSLNYDFGGIKVEQEAAQVGLGWSLSAGGMISRIIRGRDDFDGILRQGYSAQTNLNTMRQESFVISKTAQNVEWEFTKKTTPFFASSANPITGQLFLFCQSAPANPMVYNTAKLMLPIPSATEAGKPRLDGESDLFSYQAGSYSGKFIITTDASPYIIYTIAQEPVKIEIMPAVGQSSPDLTGNSGFKITTPDGVKYIFGQTEKSKSRSGFSSTGKLVHVELDYYSDPLYAASSVEWDLTNITAATETISGWYMTKIIAASNDSDIITFNYSVDSDFNTISLPNRVQSLTVGFAKWRLTDSRQKNILLTSIVSSKGSINFERSSRNDIRGTMALKLDKIIVKDQFNAQINAFAFAYDYFDSGTSAEDIVRKRLRLLTFTELGKDNSPKPSHVFSYYSTVMVYGTEQFKALPDKNSYAQDLWGLYNGEDNNNTKINSATNNVNTNPALNGTMIPAQFPSNATVWGFSNPAIREANLGYAKLGTLASIKYPTGGLMAFDLELNQFGNYTLGVLPNSIIVRDTLQNPVPFNGGGLRTKATKLYPNATNSSNYIYRKYEYTEPNGTGTSGKLMYDMLFSYIIYGGGGSPYQLFSSGTKYPTSYSANGGVIGYSFVKEIDVNPSTNATNGSTEMNFVNQIETRFDSFCFSANQSIPACNSYINYISVATCLSYTPTADDVGIYYTSLILENGSIPNYINIRNGLLNSKIIRDASGALMHEEENTYTTLNGTNKKRVKSLLASGRTETDPYPALYLYYVDTEWVKLESKITKDYQQGTANYIAVTETYQYNTNNKEVNQVDKLAANGETTRTTIKYPHDFQSTAVYQEMIAKNMVLPAIEQDLVNVTKSKAIVKIENTYKNYGSSINQRHLLEKSKKIIGGFDSGLQDFVLDYDANSNLIEVQPKSSPPISYLWAYNGNYPVAEIRGIGASNLNADLQNVGLSRTLIEGENIKSTLNNYTNTLRNYWANSPIIIENYTHLPMVSMNSQTVSNGLLTTYEHDVFNRLIAVYDNANSFTHRYAYQYATTAPSSCTTPAAPNISVSSTSLCNAVLSATGCAGVINWSNGQSGNAIALSTANSATITATCSVGTCTSTASNTLTLPVLPTGWQAIDIGSSTVNGCTQYNSGVLTMQSDGANNSIGGSDPDKFHFVYKSYTGDVSVITKLTGMSLGDGFRSGIMIRNSLDPKSVMFSIIQDNNTYVGKLLRNADNDLSYLWQFNIATLNSTWIRLDKVGNSVTAKFSTLANPNPAIATDWQDMGSSTGNPAPLMTWNGTFYLGFATMAYPAGSNHTTFTNVSVNGVGL
jgi:hypothetical protein